MVKLKIIQTTHTTHDFPMENGGEGEGMGVGDFNCTFETD